MTPAEVLGFGLTARGATFGALVVLRQANAGFSADDIAFAQRIAARAALALDSARLYEEQARLASVLQQSLRPPTLPDIPGVHLGARYRPAAEHLDIGGDFYDVTGHQDDWIIALGDVCGKGVEAAALTGQTRQSVRTAVRFDRRASRVDVGPVRDAVVRSVASTRRRSVCPGRSGHRRTPRADVAACRRPRRAGRRVRNRSRSRG